MSYSTRSPGRPPIIGPPSTVRYSSLNPDETNDNSSNPNENYRNINDNEISPADPPIRNPQFERVPLFPPTHSNDGYRLSKRPVTGGAQPREDTSPTFDPITDFRRSRSKSEVLRAWFAGSTDLQPSRAADADVPAGYHNPVAAWGIYMKTPITIISLFIIGAGAAIGHHFYYSNLNGTPAKGPADQEWVSRIGIGLAFLFKTSLVAGIGIARDQWLWVTLRKRFMSLGAIDAMFGVASDPFLFWRTDMILRAKTATVMAAVMWILPVTAIFTPGTISVIPNTLETNISCSVHSLRFPLDAVRNRIDQPSNDTSTGNRLGDYEGQRWYKPSDRAKKVLTIAGFSGKIMASPGDDIAQGCDLRCSYAISFEAPAVKCTEKTPWNMTSAPWDDPNQFINNIHNQYTLFRTERRPNELNTLWIGISLPSKDITDSDGDYLDKDIRDPHVYLCENYIARYTIRHNIIERTYREPNVTKVEFLRPVALMPTMQNSMIRPGYDAYWSTFGVLVGLLEGDIAGNKTTKVVNGTQVGSTPLVDNSVAPDGYTEPNFVPKFAEAIEKIAQTMTVSLLSDRTLIYSTKTDTICTSAFSQNIYLYNPLRLIIIYAIAAAVALVMSILGFVALEKNGVAIDGYFSTILLTTRNAMLDDLTVGSCLGGKPLPKELEKLGLKYGELCGSANMDGVAHAAMGLEGQVLKLRKRGKYS